MTIDEWKKAITAKNPDVCFAAHAAHGWSAHDRKTSTVVGVFAIDFGFCSVERDQFPLSTNGGSGDVEFQETHPSVHGALPLWRVVWGYGDRSCDEVGTEQHARELYTMLRHRRPVLGDFRKQNAAAFLHLLDPNGCLVCSHDY